MENNFTCPNCGKDQLIPVFITTTKGKYLDKKTRKELVCDNIIFESTGEKVDVSLLCGEVLQYIPKKGPFEVPNIGTFSMMSKEMKKKHLKQRSFNHGQKFHNPKDVK